MAPPAAPQASTAESLRQLELHQYAPQVFAWDSSTLFDKCCHKLPQQIKPCLLPRSQGGSANASECRAELPWDNGSSMEQMSYCI